MKRLLLDWGSCGGSPGPQCGTTVVPAPIPPWARPVQTPDVQLITGNDTVSLGVDVTYLQSTVAPPAPSAAYLVVLPNGNFMRQMKRIYIPTTQQPATAPFKITGAFNGFTSLLFNNAAVSAVLEWDGTGWILVSGDAQKSSN